MRSIVPLAVALIAIVGFSNAAEPAPLRCIEPSATTGTSRAVIVGNELLVHTSQVLPIDTTASAEVQAAEVLNSLDKKLRAAHASLHACAKLNVYAADEAAASAAMEAIKREFTKDSPPVIKPAVSLVRTRLPQPGALVAVDAVGMSMINEDSKVSLRSWGAEGRIAGSEHMAILPPGRKIFIAGQAEKADDLKSATQKTMASLASTLKFLGRTNDDIV
ncbi:MAG TPA: RidA family protein, partial [Pirellulaceae bacterium]|nr:RidA family protein [Pirellulaceae bacterium]